MKAILGIVRAGTEYVTKTKLAEQEEKRLEKRTTFFCKVAAGATISAGVVFLAWLVFTRPQKEGYMSGANLGWVEGKAVCVCVCVCVVRGWA